MKISKSVSSIMLLLLICLGLPTHEQAYPVEDTAGDTSYTGADLISVSTIGTEIKLRLSGPPTPHIYYMILLSSDNDHRTFEGAIILNLCDPIGVSYWAVGNLLPSDMLDQTASGAYRIVESILFIQFPDFGGLAVAEIFTLTLVPTGKGFYDWAPNAIVNKDIFNIFNPIISPYKANPFRTSTTVPTTDTSSTSTSTSDVPSTSTEAPTTSTISTTTSSSVSDSSSSPTTTTTETDFASEIGTSENTQDNTSSLDIKLDYPHFMLGCLVLIITARMYPKKRNYKI